ncbi:MAG: hypothetical protein JXK05_09585 [Campylobacterales bacterium]|nr:hypothetical protein [Campylobacterales bacterium]
MNSVQAFGWYLIFEGLWDAIKPEEHDKIAKMVFGVKAKKVDIEAVERAVVEAKKVQMQTVYDYTDPEISALRQRIAGALSYGRLSAGTNTAISDALDELDRLQDRLAISADDVKVYLREVLKQIKHLEYDARKAVKNG